MSGPDAAVLSTETIVQSDEERELREVARDLMEREAAETPAGFAAGDRRQRSWSLVAELGWPAIAIPEAAGGLELGLLAQAGLLEEAGRGMFAGPLATTAVASGFLLTASVSPERDGFLARVAAGAAATFASGDGALVPDADLAEFAVLVRPGGSEGLDSVFVIAADALSPRPTEPEVDPGRPLFACELDLAAAIDLGPAAGAVALGRAVLAAELVGVAAAAIDVTLAHVRDREQFGRPLGAFQAVKHQLADAYVALERARSLTRGALSGQPLSRPPAELTVAAAMAKAAASEAALGAVRTGIQLSGALGTTAEYPLPWLLRRARVGGLLLGGSEELYALVGAAVEEAAR